MAFNDFRKTKDEVKLPAASAGGGVGALTAFIDQGSEFSGKLNFKDTVRIDGRFEGEISSENTLIVGESGSVTATIKSQVVIISGEVHREITASGQSSCTRPRASTATSTPPGSWSKTARASPARSTSGTS